MSSLIPKGSYMWEIVPQETDEGPMSCVFGEASTGTKQVSIQARCVTEGEHKGKIRTWTGYFTSEDTTAATLEALTNAGFEGTDVGKYPFQTITKPFNGGIVHEEDKREGKNGQIRDRLRFINRQGGGKVMEGKYSKEKRDVFTAMLSARLAGTSSAATNGTTAKPAAVPSVKI